MRVCVYNTYAQQPEGHKIDILEDILNQKVYVNIHGGVCYQGA